MTKKLLYKEASADDLKQLKELAIIAYAPYSNVLTSENRETFNKSLNDEKALLALILKSKVFTCSDENTIVGMAFLIPHGNPTDIYHEDWCYIRMVGVHPGFTGQGIGRKLTEMCIEKAKELSEEIIALHTSEFMKSARHIYTSLGFKILKEIPPKFGKRYWLYTLHI